ncbi:MAG TPA: TonB-dependent receptor [Steroidobacteraceae bacterium]|nr:TonB-dependent receptor [Steroidobacteraceae bacterium]
MSTSIRTGLVALGALLPLAAAQAQQAAPAAASNDLVLSEIIITATRVAQPANEALEPIVLIDRAALEDSLASDVGDVLRFHAGIDLGRSGGPGQPLSLFIRGTKSDQSIVMIDGVRINPGTYGGAPLQNLAPELFERIEIVKGPRSAIYGTDAIGGVVNLVTRRSGPDGVDAMVGYGRYSTGEFSLAGHYEAGASLLQAALTGERSDGFPTFTADTVDRGYKNLSGTLTAQTRLAGLELGALYWRAAGRSDYANQLYGNDFPYPVIGYSAADEDFADSVFAVHAAGNISDPWHMRLTLSRNVDDLRQNQADPYDLNLAKDYDITARNTVDLQNDVTIGGGSVGQVLTFGVILAQEHTDSLSFGTQYAVSTNAQTYYLQDQLKLGSSRLLLAGGDYRHPAFGNHATWNAEYGYSASGRLLLTLSAGTAFRAPSATDRFGYGANPDLLPEQSRNVEAGIKWRVGATQQLGVAAFQNTIDELITTIYAPPAYSPLNINIDRARIRGIEASWDAQLDAWSLHAEGDWQDPRNLADDSLLLRRARQGFVLGAARRFSRGEAGVDLLQSGPRADTDVASGAPVTDGGYVLLGLHAKFALTPAWSLTARLENALDRRYELSSGYNTAGRALFVATRFSFR